MYSYIYICMSLSLSMCIYIYIYIHMIPNVYQIPNGCCRVCHAPRGSAPRATAGIGTPDPNPKHLVLVVSDILLSILHLSKLVIWGSTWGRGFRFHS